MREPSQPRTLLPVLVLALSAAHLFAATAARGERDSLGGAQGAGAPWDGEGQVRIEEALRRAEYRFSPAPGGRWTAPNRAHDLRIRSRDGGIELVSRTGGAEAWELFLRLEGLGRPGAIRPVGPGALAARGARLERDRPGITEWLVNTEEGLEHGFTLVEPPDPIPAEGGGRETAVVPGEDPPGGMVVLRLSLEGSLRPRPIGGGRGLALAPPGGAELLRYDGLRVLDADGGELPAWMELDGGEVLLVFEEGSAVYPVTIDPLLSSAAWTLSGAAGDELAFSISTAGDVDGDGYSDILVGAPMMDGVVADAGGALLFRGGPSGPSPAPDWTVSPSVAGSRFGHAVSAAGDVNGDGYGDVIVGAPLWSNGTVEEGKAFLWLGGPGGLGPSGDETTADWSAEGGLGGSHLGWSVADAGDVNGNGYGDVILGAPGWSNGEAGEGRALVFLGVSGGLAAFPAWTAESDQSCPAPPSCPAPALGWSVAGAGDVNADGFDDLLVGAPFYDDATQDYEGWAFLWHGNASFGSGMDGTPANAQWWGQGDVDYGHFGISVGSAGDVDGDGYAEVIIGADEWADTHTWEGAVFVWKGGPLGLGPVGTPVNAWWHAQSEQTGGEMGQAVGTAGDVNGDGYADLFAASGTYQTALPLDGGAWVWLGGPAGPAPATGLPSNADWSATSAQTGSAFGAAAGAAGDVDGDGFGDFLVGGHSDDTAGTDAGRAWIYRGSSSGPSLAADVTLEADQAGASFGLSVASAGDVNGDGFDELIVGAPFFDNGEADEGQAFLFLGSAGGLFLLPSWIAQGDQANANLGTSVASAGDVNGDGYDDVVVGAPGHVKTLAGEGAAFLWLGGPGSGADPAGLGGDGHPANADWENHGGLAGAGMGRAVAPAGDVNGDGFGDLIVGAPFTSNGEVHEGRAWVFPGSAGGLGAPLWSRESDSAGARFGQSVACAGDVNADGFSDILIGAPFHTGGLAEQGRAELYLGSGLGPSAAPDWFYLSSQAQSHAGVSVASAGDVDGDGFSDWMVGAPDEDVSGGPDRGVAYLWLGTGGPLTDPAAWLVAGVTDFERLGASVAPAGDLNLDGYGDIVIGAPAYNGALGSMGYAAAWHGGPGGPAPGASYFFNDWLVEGQDAMAQLGLSVASAGDVNGDGFPELVTGAPFRTSPDAGEGGVFLFMGNGVDGLHRIPVQARADDTARLGPLGRSESDSSFTVRGLGRSSAGRAGVRLQWEIEPLGATFDGTGLQSGVSFLDSGAPDFLNGSAQPLSEVASGLDPGTFYHWRVRIASDNPRHPWTPWMSPSFNAPTETDLRTQGCVDGDGDGYGAVLDPKCAGGAILDCDDGNTTVNPGHAELCDGLDNNCDGATDEGNPGGGAPCNSGLPGVCTPGTTICQGGALACEPNRQPSPETCDGLDNNCDGATDEGNPGGGGACDTGLPGVCAAGTEACQGGSLTCLQDTGPSAEVCNGLDDDCDGTVPDTEIDDDGDGLAECEGDCDDKDGGSIATPGPVTGLNVVPLNPGYRHTWDSQHLTAGRRTVYDVYGGPAADIRPLGDFSTGECEADDLITPQWDDLSPDPAPGEAFYFMFRGQNGCPVGTGTFGNNFRDAGHAASASPCG